MTLVKAFDTLVGRLRLEPAANCPDPMRDWGGLLSMLLSDEFAGVGLLGGLKHVDDIILALAPSISFKPGTAMEWYRNKVPSKFDHKPFAHFWMGLSIKRWYTKFRINLVTQRVLSQKWNKKSRLLQQIDKENILTCARKSYWKKGDVGGVWFFQCGGVKFGKLINFWCNAYVQPWIQGQH